MWLENTFENEGPVDRLFVREHPFLRERKKDLLPRMLLSIKSFATMATFR